MSVEGGIVVVSQHEVRPGVGDAECGPHREAVAHAARDKQAWLAAHPEAVVE